MDLKRLKEIVVEPEEDQFTFPPDIDILNAKLSVEQQEVILLKLFGFNIIDGVILDEYDFVFYNNNKNAQYDLTTIGGIIIYAMDRAHELGFRKCQINAVNKLQECNHLDDAISYFKEQIQNI